jgi:hypothetical protein
MGCSQGISMQFNLGTLLHKVDVLDDLTRPFEKKEIADVIKC